MFTRPPLLLSTIITDETTGPVNVHRLAQLINEANREVGTNCSVNGRMLAKIRDEPRNVGITYDVLVAIHIYLLKNGKPGLQERPILETRGLLEVLMHSPRVVFMLGARPRKELTEISRWDTRSLAVLLTQASKLDVHREFDVEDVLRQTPVDPEDIRTERWYRFLEDDQASVVSLGSPLAALSSEIMLAGMFGVKAFVPPRVGMPRQLPFFFVWLPKLVRNFSSAFALTWRDLHTDFPELATQVKGNQASAFILEGKPHVVTARGTSWTTHGIIAAQRRAAGNVWAVVSGLAGPATHAASMMVKEIATELPWAKGQPSKVLWVPVKAKIKADETTPTNGDVREIVKVEFDGEPRIWP